MHLLFTSKKCIIPEKILWYFSFNMDFRGFCILALLASVWGASFMFYRILVPEIGVLWTVEFRVGLAALFLYIYCRIIKKSLAIEPSKLWLISLIGLGNMGPPYLLFGYAALHLESSYLSILNATVPFFTLIVAYFFLQAPIRIIQILGIFLGLAGVVVLVGLGKLEVGKETIIAAACCLLATMSYAINISLTKRYLASFNQYQITFWGLFISTCLFAIPAAYQYEALFVLNTKTILAALGLSVLSTAFAYILFYKLIADYGALSASSVTFLIPLFGSLLGWLFLQESIDIWIFIGGACILFGAYLVNKRQKTA